MKLVIAKETLSTALRKVLNAVSTRTTLPALNNVLLEVDANGLKLTATDLEVCIQSHCSAQVHENGETTLPARKLGQIVNVLPEGDITLSSDENNTTSISCGQAYFRIMGLDASEFPREELDHEQWSFTMSADEFRRNINKVSYAASSSENRQILNGVLFSVRDNMLTTAATDGRRLALVEKSLETEEIQDGDVILPPKAVTELQRTLDGEGDMTVHLSETKAQFSAEETVVISKLVEGTYPNYRQVVPESFAHSLVVNREQFAEVLNRVALVASGENASVRLDIENSQMTMSATSSEIGESREPMEISYDGDPIQIAFNPVYLADPLKRMEAEQLVIQFNDEYSPISLSGDEGFLYIIMPMRTEG